MTRAFGRTIVHVKGPAKRALRALCLVIALGTVVNVLVGWLIAAANRRHATIGEMADGSSTVMARGYENGNATFVYSTNGMTNKSVITVRVPMDPHDYRSLDTDHFSSTLKEIDLPTWGAVNAAEGAITDLGVIVVDRAFGFPLPSLRYRISAQTSEETIVPSFIEVKYGVELSTHHDSWLSLPAALPMRPIWTPFVINVIFYSLVVFAFFASLATRKR